MPARFDHEKLRAYQEALRFVAWVGPIIDELPGKSAVRDQLDRASGSIPLNIAEGNGKRSGPDRCRFLDIARGSSLECAACLDVLVSRAKMTAERADEGKQLLLGVVAMIAGLIGRFDGHAEEEPGEYLVPAVGPMRRTRTSTRKRTRTSSKPTPSPFRLL